MTDKSSAEHRPNTSLQCLRSAFLVHEEQGVMTSNDHVTDAMNSQTTRTLLSQHNAHTSAPHVEGQVSRTGCNKSRCLYLLLLFMALAATVILASVVFVRDKNNKILATFQESICVPHDRLFKDSDGQIQVDLFIDQLTKRKENGVELYCANNFEQLSELMQRVFRPAALKNVLKKEASVISKTNVLKPKTIMSSLPKAVSAHKAFVNETSEYLKRKRLSNVVLNFNLSTSDSLAEHVKNVGVTSSSLDIQVAGFYYVYSHVAFVSKKSFTGCSSKNSAFSLKVRRNHPRFRETLDQGKTTCRNFSTGRVKSGFVAGVFWLNASDSVYVQMTRKAHREMLYKKELSFLGLFLLSQEELKVKEKG